MQNSIGAYALKSTDAQALLTLATLLRSTETSQGLRTTVSDRLFLLIQETRSIPFEVLTHLKSMKAPASSNASVGEQAVTAMEGAVAPEHMLVLMSTAQCGHLARISCAIGRSPFTRQNRLAWAATVEEALGRSGDAQSAATSGLPHSIAPAALDEAFTKAKASRTGPKPKEPILELSASQKVLFATYSEGDFAHIAEAATPEAFAKELDLCGDGLLRFLAIELASSESCDSLEVGVARVRSAARDLDNLMHALQDAEISAEAAASSVQGATGAQQNSVVSDRPRGG